MAMFKCSLCSKRPQGRMASGYWSYIGGDGQRIAFKQRYCHDCYMQQFEPFWLEMAERDNVEYVERCVICNSQDAESLDTAWSTMYVPGRDPESLMVTFCREHKGVTIELIERNKISLKERSDQFARADAWA